MFREADEDESGFMCCAFSARERFLMLGTCTGQLKLYNVFTGQEEASYSCHSSAITHLEPSRVSTDSNRHIICFTFCLVVPVAVCNLACKIFGDLLENVFCHLLFKREICPRIGFLWKIHVGHNIISNTYVLKYVCGWFSTILFCIFRMALCS